MIRQLDHYNIRTGKIDETVRFYTDVLGLRDGPFPGDRRFGAWLYDTTDRPVLHLIAVEPNNREEAYSRIKARLGDLAGTLDDFVLQGSGAIDHVAFECENFDGMRDRLQSLGLKFSQSDIPSINLRQLFVNDPNGVTLELNFR